MKDSSLPVNPLRLAEILELVFSFLGADAGVLALAIRVNSQWFDLIAPMLWNGAPGCALVGLEEHCRQVYAPKMTKLVFERPREHMASWYAVTLGEEDVTRRDVIRQYLTPSIQRVRALDIANDALLDDIRTTCTNLKQLYIGNGGLPLSWQVLQRLLLERTSLEDVSLLNITSQDKLGHIVKCLASMPNLLRVALQEDLTRDGLQRIAGTIAVPFSKLQTFEGRVLPDAIPLLAHCVKNVTKLHVHIHSIPDDPFRSISELTGLRSLEVFFEFGTLQRSDVMALIPLQNLTILRVLHRSLREDLELVPEAAFPTQDFAALLSSIGRNLQYFDLDLPCTVPSALDLLPKLCPLVRTFNMAGLACELPARERPPGGLLYNIEHLAVRSFINSRDSYVLE